MSNLAGLPPLGLKDTTPKKDPEHLARVAELPCICCRRKPVEAHHCTHGRYSQRKSSDRETIPLCRACHWRLHNHPAEWKADFGLDFDWLPVVADMLEGTFNYGR